MTHQTHSEDSPRRETAGGRLFMHPSQNHAGGSLAAE